MWIVWNNYYNSKPEFGIYIARNLPICPPLLLNPPAVPIGRTFYTWILSMNLLNVLCMNELRNNINIEKSNDEIKYMTVVKIMKIIPMFKYCIRTCIDN